MNFIKGALLVVAIVIVGMNANDPMESWRGYLSLRLMLALIAFGAYRLLNRSDKTGLDKFYANVGMLAASFIFVSVVFFAIAFFLNAIGDPVPYFPT